MRFVALDTETTGLTRSSKLSRTSVCSGHRIVEIGCVEVVDGELTGRTFHRYVNPQCVVDPKATLIHGITDGFLRDKPVFGSIVRGLLSFIGRSNIVIHNAPFDIAFLDKEFNLLSPRLQPVGRVFTVTDTLVLARRMFPRQDNSLDGLALRCGFESRVLHGALSDAAMLARIYLLIFS